MALSQNTKKLIIRIALFLVYLLLGAAIFQAIELYYEKKARDSDQFQELKGNFTTKYNISDEDMRNFLRNLKKAISLGFDLQQGDYPKRYQWNFMNAFFFAGNVVTTIGYGHIVPTSFWGRFFCIFYALVGIPLTGLTLRSVGNRVSEGISSAVKQFDRRVYNRETEKLEIKTAVIAFILLLIIVIFPAFGFEEFEDWNYFESVYFCFITLSTIGFGDFVPGKIKERGDQNDAIYVVLEFLNLIYMVLGLAVMSGVIVSISGVIEEKTKNISMADPLEALKTIRVENLNSRALKKLGYKMGPTPREISHEDMRHRKPPTLHSLAPRALEESPNLDRSQSADNMEFQGPTPILHLNKNNLESQENVSELPRTNSRPKLMFQNKVNPVTEGDSSERVERKTSSTLSLENRTDSDEIERELAPTSNSSRRNTLTEKKGSKNELVVEAQITPLPSPRSSPVPSPAPADHAHCNPRDKPAIETNEQTGLVTNEQTLTNGEQDQSHDLPSVEIIDKNSRHLNGFVVKPKPIKGGNENPAFDETLELNEVNHHPVVR